MSGMAHLYFGPPARYVYTFLCLGFNLLQLVFKLITIGKDLFIGYWHEINFILKNLT